jgi:hypothetical protein
MGLSNILGLLDQQYQRLVKYPNSSSFAQPEPSPFDLTPIKPISNSEVVKQLMNELEQTKLRLAKLEHPIEQPSHSKIVKIKAKVGPDR